MGMKAIIEPEPAKREPRPEDVCRRCYRTRAKHRLVNYSDGPQVGETVEVCPTATFSFDRD